jgi:hypothetical protein
MDSLNGLLTNGLLGNISGLVLNSTNIFGGVLNIEVIQPPQNEYISGGGGGGIPQNNAFTKKQIKIKLVFNGKEKVMLYDIDDTTAKIVVKSMDVINKAKITVGNLFSK